MDNGSFNGIQKPSNQVTQIKDTKFAYQEFCTETKGKISVDYKFNLSMPWKRHLVKFIEESIKLITKKLMTEEDGLRITREVDILKQLDHLNIISIYEFYQDSEYFYIVTELWKGGELFDRLISEKNFSEKRLPQLWNRYQVQQHIAMKKIFQNSIPDINMDQRVGTPYYMAPEALDKNYNEKCDIWSCDVILYIMLCGAPPFDGDDDNEIMEAVRKGALKFKEYEWKIISNEAKDLVMKMIEKDTKRRISTKDAMNHAWIQTYLLKEGRISTISY